MKDAQKFPKPPPATARDYWASIFHVFFIVTSLCFALFRQILWRWLYNMKNYNEYQVVRKNAGVLLEKVTVPLPKGTLNSDEREKLRKASKALNGIMLINKTMEDWMWKFEPYWKRIIEYEQSLEFYNSRSFLFMGNHSSYADVFCTAALGFNFATVGMASLLAYPVGGSVLKNAGYLAVHFKKKPNGKWGTDPVKTREMIQQSIDYLEHGLSVFIFPEGNLNPHYELAEFKPGFFTVGRTVGIEVIPVALHGTKDVWPMSSRSVPRFPLSTGTVFIKVGSPMKQLNNTDISVLNTEEEIKTYLEKEYKINFSNGHGIKDFGSVFSDIVAMNAQEQLEGEEYEKLMNNLFRHVVKKKIFEMRIELEEKAKKYHQL